MNNFDFKRPAVKWGTIAAAVLVVLFALGWIFNGAISRMARERAIKGMQDKFAGNLQMQKFEVSVFPSLHVTGEGLILRYHGRTDLPPLISIRKFQAEGALPALLIGHVSLVRLEGLEIQVPPKTERVPGDKEKKSNSERVAGFVIDKVIADGTVLKTLPKDPGKDPLEWDIQKLTLTSAGPTSPMAFQATLMNAKPPGQIESTGKFGPWQTDEPGDTPVEGNYTFKDADLSVFKGISGILSSEGSYTGVLEEIKVKGTTDVPDFTVKISGNPVHLTTTFQAVVDGTDGNTWLRPVDAKFGASMVHAEGGIVGIKGVKGKTVDLDVTVNDARLEDMLRMGVKSKTPMMTGAISYRTKLVIPPGDEDVAQKLKLDGQFNVSTAHFTKLDIQEKVNKLSHSGKGEPEEPPSDTVASDFAGQFKMDKGVIALRNLSFKVPGVAIALNGQYGLIDEKMEFHGTATLEAKLSEATTGFKSFLLKAVDPFFKKKDAGAVIPIKITGTRDKPSFGLDIGH